MRIYTTLNKFCSSYIFKWFMVIILFTINIVINYIYSNLNLFIRILYNFIIIITAIRVVFLTRPGKNIIIFFNEALIELKKIVWPSFKDTLSITLIVISVTTVMSMILWGIDGILVRLVSYIIGMRL